MIKLFAVDVDGTLTDGGIFMDGAGNEFKCFNVQDGLGLRRLMDAGVEVAIISGRYSASTAQRAKDLGIVRCINGSADKFSCLKGMAAELEIGPEGIAFVGDDLPDLECMKWAGFSIAVADARPEILGVADWITPRLGGYGAVRDAAEYVLSLNKQEEDPAR